MESRTKLWETGRRGGFSCVLAYVAVVCGAMARHDIQSSEGEKEREREGEREGEIT